MGPNYPFALKRIFFGKTQTCHFCLLTILGFAAKFEKILRVDSEIITSVVLPQFPPKHNFLGKLKHAIFVLSIYLVMVQSLKNILRADPEIMK